MNKIITIRRENKNKWERRTPLIPEDVKWLQEKQGVETIIQPSPVRIFPASEYIQAGAREDEQMGSAQTVFAIKEIPPHLFEPGKTYLFFSHTIKGQKHNMPMLQKMMDLGCNLIDYERIMDTENRRLIFFGPYAGMAGMIETLKAFGEKLRLRGFSTPFERIRHAYEYTSLDEAKKEITGIGEEIARTGFPLEIAPLVIGFAGYGNVSRGAQEIFDLFPHKIISPEVMREMAENFSSDTGTIYKLIFKEEDLVHRLDRAPFNLDEYFRHPELYESKFDEYIPYLTILINGIFWTEKYPRLITKKYLRDTQLIRSNSKLLVIGDISCDIGGSIEITYDSTKPDAPCYTYFPDSDRYESGVQRLGLTVMAVDNLPCEFPRESSRAFSNALREFVGAVAGTDFSLPYEKLPLPNAVKKALILHCGKLTPPFRYMQEFLDKETT